MPLYLIYVLKVSLCLAILFLFYAALLRPLTYYTWNRYYLVVMPILSGIIPFVHAGAFLEVAQKNEWPLLFQVPAVTGHGITAALHHYPKASVPVWLLPMLYATVAIILAVRLLVQLLSIQRMKGRSTLMQRGTVNVYHLGEPVLPFSFGNDIFINHNAYTKQELEKILDHERVHVQQKHTIDVLVTEIICLLNWYNPFAWLIRKAVRENLEFIADDAVVSRSASRKMYQYLLLKVTGSLPATPACSLKRTALKNRICMMNKSRTPPLHLFKFVLLLPVTACLIIAFSSSQAVKPGHPGVVTTHQEKYVLSTLTYVIPDTKVKAIVLGTRGQCLLKPGQQLDLSLVYNEQNRLVNLLEENGFRHLSGKAIRFVIDTASVRNQFSVEIHINVSPAVVSLPRQPGSVSFNTLILSGYTDQSYCSIVMADKVPALFA